MILLARSASEGHAPHTKRPRPSLALRASVANRSIWLGQECSTVQASTFEHGRLFEQPSRRAPLRPALGTLLDKRGGLNRTKDWTTGYRFNYITRFTPLTRAELTYSLYLIL